MVRLEVTDRVAVLTLADARRRNRLTSSGAAEIVARVDEAAARDDVGALVVAAEGPAFCAGADLALLQSASPEQLRPVYDIFLRLAGSRLPTVAAVEGPAVGAGMNLALACDALVMSTDGVLVSRFLDIGLHPGGGCSWLISRSGGARLAASMLLFGEEIGGEAAARAGLAARCVGPGEALDAALALARRAASVPSELTQRVKQTLAAVAEVERYPDAVDLEGEAQAWSIGRGWLAERLESKP